VSITVSSPDGRGFQFAGARGQWLESGAFVTLREPHAGGRERTTQLGQIEAVTHSLGGAAQGSGRLLGTLGADSTLDDRRTTAFDEGEMAGAEPRDVEALHRSTGASLEIGRYLAAADESIKSTADATPARLLPHRFNRHTFWCGQSGSGKTYALGVVLEQLLVHTALPMVVFDPNADFVRLGEAGGATPAGAVLAARDIRILRPANTEPDCLRVRFTDLSTSAKGAVLHLDPLVDRAEFNELLHLEETLGSVRPEQIVPSLRARGTVAAAELAARLENLRVTDWQVWAGRSTTAIDVIESRPDATVLDLGGFDQPDEPLVVALAVLDDLWTKRESRRPLLIVIDEAHNLCSPETTSPLHVAVRERLIQIAAEGRKFGLWLLLSTQRPSRVHASVISQCDNLALMKMTSPVDLDELATIFGFVPPSMFARSPRFRQGEALFAGGFAPAPSMVRMGERLTPEGGGDVTVPLRGI
jgi:DNA helicase HerA-like ATPase